MDDFVNAIEYEVKQEIASRYFGFRSQIETESGDYLERLHQADRNHLGEILLDLRRMRFLLHQEKLFKDFLLLAGLPDIFIGSSGQSPAAELFTGVKGEGFSRRRRYRDLALKVYRSLGKHVADYRETWLDLVEEHAEICASIDSFHRNNDLSGILNFLKTFNSSDNERLRFLHTEGRLTPGRSLDQDLRIPHPRPATDILPDLPALPPLKRIKKPFIELLESAYSFHASPQTVLPI